MNKKNIATILPIVIILALSSCKKQHIRDFSPQRNFDALWEILDRKYCFFEEKNIDWQGVKDVYQPKIATLETQLDMFDLFAAMLDTLQDGHVNLYSQLDISRCRGWFENYPANFDEKLIYSDRYLGKNYRIGGGFRYRTIADGKVGYIRYSSFSNSISASSLKYIESIFRNCKGIIIDIRNNGGGSIGYSEEFASIFMNKPTLTGYIRHKTGTGHSDFSEAQPIYTQQHNSINWSNKRVVILVNRLCYSATNDFVCRVKNAPSITILGGKTGGGGGIPLSDELPNGWLIRFSAVQILDRHKKHIEFGIEPDITVTMDSTDLQKGYDTLIEKAVEIIGA